MAQDPFDLPSGAITALQQGDKVLAIKLLRRFSSLGLLQSKEIVELYIQHHPELQARIEQAERKSQRGCLLGFAFFVVVAILIAVLLFLKIRFGGLTISSTRTQPARSAFMSHVLDSSSSFVGQPPVGPVNISR